MSRCEVSKSSDWDNGEVSVSGPDIEGCVSIPGNISINIKA